LLSQIRAQGDTVAGPREVSDTVPLDHIPELMCAMGYYPTQSEITDIISNLASAAALRKEPKPTTVDLEKLLYLYYNFSPVDGVRSTLLPLARSARCCAGRRVWGGVASAAQFCDATLNGAYCASACRVQSMSLCLACAVLR